MFDKIFFLGSSFFFSGEPSGVYDVAAGVSGVSGACPRSTIGRSLSSSSSKSGSEGNNLFCKVNR